MWEFLVADERGGKVDKGREEVSVAFVADGQTAIADEPGKGAFDLPSMTTEPGGIVDPAAGDTWDDAPAVQPVSVDAVVVAFVGAQPLGPAAARAAPGPDRRNRCHQRPQHDAVVDVGAGHGGNQWQTIRIGQDMDLRSGLAAIDRITAGQRSLFLARTLAESTIAADQLTSPPAPSRSSTSRCNRSKKPASAQAQNRRCAVGTLTPNDDGNCRHAHPLVNTNTIATNTARSSTGAVPPPCRRAANFGISGSAMSHKASGTIRRARASITEQAIRCNYFRPHETTSKELLSVPSHI